VRISGEARPGFTSGDAIAEMERLAGKLPRGFGYEWTGQSLQEKLSGSQAPLLLGLSVLVVFLLLAALYESWTIPLAVLLTVPLGICGAVIAATLRGLPNDVYFTVGLITIIGLAAKDAILIIEFAKDLRAQGKPLVEATIEACSLRFRPILMTGLAFVCGVLPMAIATGAGGASQQALGSTVMGGMIAVVILALLMVPVFFVSVQRVLAGELVDRVGVRVVQQRRERHDPRRHVVAPALLTARHARVELLHAVVLELAVRRDFARACPRVRAGAL
jgi:multidrug efflux pump